MNTGNSSQILFGFSLMSTLLKKLTTCESMWQIYTEVQSCSFSDCKPWPHFTLQRNYSSEVHAVWYSDFKFKSTDIWLVLKNQSKQTTGSLF